MEGANFCINGSKAFRINSRILIFIYSPVWIIPHPIDCDAFLTALLASLIAAGLTCGRGSTGAWKGVQRLEVSVQCHHSIHVSTWETGHSKFDAIKIFNAKILQFLFLYGAALCEIYENLHQSKISHYMVFNSQNAWKANRCTHIQTKFLHDIYKTSFSSNNTFCYLQSYKPPL